jgi:hypothetical protein
MSESRSAAGPAFLVFGCLGLLVISLMVASVGMVMIVFRAASEAPADRMVVGPMDPGWPAPPVPVPAAPAPPLPASEPLAAPMPEPIAAPDVEPFVEVEPIPATPPPALAALTRTVVARITRVSGNTAGLRRGGTCRFPIDRVDTTPDGTFYRCRARASCGEVLVYGGPTSGYFDCTLDAPPSLHVRGADTSTSADDSDAAFDIDTHAGRLSIRDDAEGQNGAFTLEARVVGVE